MTTIETHTESMREKLDTGLSPELAAALRTATADETQGIANIPDPEALSIDQAKAANIEGWKTAVLQVVPMIEAMVPEFKRHVSREQWGEFGHALGGAMDHYGIGLGDALSHPLAILAFSSVPIVLAGVKIKQERLDAAQLEQPPAALPPVQTPTPPHTQTPGAIQGGAGVTVRVMDASQAPS